MSGREEILARDAEDLRRLGYGQQLLREMGGFSNFAVSFSWLSAAALASPTAAENFPTRVLEFESGQ